MITLEDLWYGNINPHEQFLEDNEKLKELLPIMAKDREKLSVGLSPEQAEWLEKYDDIINEMHSNAEVRHSNMAFGLQQYSSLNQLHNIIKAGLRLRFLLFIK